MADSLRRMSITINRDSLSDKMACCSLLLAASRAIAVTAAMPSSARESRSSGVPSWADAADTAFNALAIRCFASGEISDSNLPRLNSAVRCFSTGSIEETIERRRAISAAAADDVIRPKFQSECAFLYCTKNSLNCIAPPRVRYSLRP